jgi:hypothetical protein
MPSLRLKAGKPMQKPKSDPEDLPPERAAAQRLREAKLLGLLGAASLKPVDLLKPAPERGLSSRLSPNELNTLRRIAHGAGETADLNRDHIARLVLLKLVSRLSNDVVITTLGKQRIVQAS